MSFDRIVNATMDRIDQKVRMATIGVFGSVIKMTPVDTGRAKGNWQCTVGTPAIGETDRVDNSPLNDIGASSDDMLIANTPRHAGSKVYLTNNLPYIEKLEYGHSMQAPSGMVRISIERFEGLMS